MSKRKEEKQTLENILRLDSLRDRLDGADLKKLDTVIEEMRRSVGETVSKSNAAEMFDVSRQTVDKWISKDLLPSVKSQSGRQRIPRQNLERAVKEIRSMKEKSRGRAASALRSMASDIEGKKVAKKPAKKTSTQKTSAKKPAAKKTTKKTTKKTSAKKAS